MPWTLLNQPLEYLATLNKCFTCILFIFGLLSQISRPNQVSQNSWQEASFFTCYRIEHRLELKYFLFAYFLFAWFLLKFMGSSSISEKWKTWGLKICACQCGLSALQNGQQAAGSFKFQHPAGIEPNSLQLTLTLRTSSFQSPEEKSIWLVVSCNLESIFQ